MSSIKKPPHVVMVGWWGPDAPTTECTVELLPLLAALVTAAGRRTLHALRDRRVVGRLAGVRGLRVRDRFADQRPCFGERQFAETFGRNDLSALAHVLHRIAENLAVERHLDDALVTVAVDGRANFARRRLGNLLGSRLMGRIPLASAQQIDDPVIHLRGRRARESGFGATGGEDPVQVGDVHGIELLCEVLAQD